jgi:hypothetical protein
MELLDRNWEAVWQQLQSYDPKDDVFFMITLNKGQEDEYRTRFMTYNEAADLIFTAVSKKKVRIATT